jgi:hypothetical protein
MKLLLKPHSGLANRIRVMVSGISLAQKLNCPIEIIWENEKELVCGYYDLFKKNDDLNITGGNWRTNIIDKVRAKRMPLILLKELLNIGFIMYDINMKEYVWNTGSNYIDLSKINNRRKDIYIKSCNEFYYHPENLNYFLPNDEIQEIVEITTKHFSAHTIGVHIRRTDHKVSIAESPLSSFKEKMYLEIENNADVVFYLATDDPEVKSALKSEFGDRLFYADVVFNRNTRDGVRSAMVDLHSLARTTKIYGSYWSSFSDMAARFGEIPLIIVRKV